MIAVNCACGFSAQVPDNFAGKQVRCRQCSAVIDVAAPGEEALTVDQAAVMTPTDPTPSKPPRPTPEPSKPSGSVMAPNTPSGSVAALSASASRFPITQVQIVDDRSNWFSKGFFFGLGVLVAFVVFFVTFALFVLMLESFGKK